MKCGHVKADRDVLGIPFGFCTVELFRGVLAKNKKNPVVLREVKIDLKQMLHFPINLPGFISHEPKISICFIE
jgi:hypothetical protein